MIATAAPTIASANTDFESTKHPAHTPSQIASRRVGISIARHAARNMPRKHASWRISLYGYRAYTHVVVANARIAVHVLATFTERPRSNRNQKNSTHASAPSAAGARWVDSGRTSGS